MSASVLDRVKKVICKELSISENEVDESKSFTEDLGADSLYVVEIVMALEEEFGVEIPDDDVGDMKTVGDAVTYIQGKLG
ncbi:acyl carrier protein [Kamptonema cortianum]|nr:acyl carrier protein [Geitlerinema splendidum]MDK3156906.1 acyl carrier protein [Kamptonema cortianum]